MNLLIYIIIIIIIILTYIYFVSVFYTLFPVPLLSNEETKKLDLQKDGVCVLNNIFTRNECNYLKSCVYEKNTSEILKELKENINFMSNIRKVCGNSEYVLHDYVWIIKRGAVHTCHRDNNGDFFNIGQKHPSYTMLIYFTDNDLIKQRCLGVIPRSHLKMGSYGINFTNPTVDLPCSHCSIILFNANLIHVGNVSSIHQLRIQLKVSHREDLPILKYYQDYYKITDKENILSKKTRSIQKNLSCMFPFISDLTQKENIKTARGTSDKEVKIGFMQKLFSGLFYGDTNYYDLNNIK